jgi:hypothetical protein
MARNKGLEGEVQQLEGKLKESIHGTSFHGISIGYEPIFALFEQQYRFSLSHTIFTKTLGTEITF